MKYFGWVTAQWRGNESGITSVQSSRLSKLERLVTGFFAPYMPSGNRHSDFYTTLAWMLQHHLLQFDSDHITVACHVCVVHNALFMIHYFLHNKSPNV